MEPPVSTRWSASFQLPAGWWQSALIILAGLFIYAPVFHGSWLIDDHLELTDNHVVQDPAGLPKIWHGDAGAEYLPLKTSVQWLLWQTFGGNPIPYHLSSIALHLLSAFLLWRLFGRLGMRHAWIGGLLFVAHPILVESVSWVAEFKNTLSLTVLLLSMLTWQSFDEHRRRGNYAASLALFAAALLCKTSVVMWPVVILLYAWWKRGSIRRSDLKLSLPFFAISFLAGLLSIYTQTHWAIRTESYPLGGITSRLALAGMEIVFYLWKIVLPVNLLPMYPQWRIDPPAVWDFLPWPFLLAVSYWLWTKRKTRWAAALCLGLGFFVVNLFPVLGFFRISYMRISWVSDHFVYVSSVGIIGLFAAGLSLAYNHLSLERRSYARFIGWIALACLVLASRLHAEVYSGLEPLSRYTVQRNPDAWLAHQLYAATSQQHGDFDTALTQANEAVRLRPDIAETQNSLGMALDSKGQFQAASKHLQAAARIAPHNGAIRQNLARCLLEAGQYELALEEYLPLLEQFPRDPSIHSNAGACLYNLNRFDDAADQFRQALAINPALSSVRANLALALRQGERQGNPSPPPAP